MWRFSEDMSVILVNNSNYVEIWEQNVENDGVI